MPVDMRVSGPLCLMHAAREHHSHTRTPHSHEHFTLSASSKPINIRADLWGPANQQIGNANHHVNGWTRSNLILCRPFIFCLPFVIHTQLMKRRRSSLFFLFFVFFWNICDSPTSFTDEPAVSANPPWTTMTISLSELRRTWIFLTPNSYPKKHPVTTKVPHRTMPSTSAPGVAVKLQPHSPHKES
jgi:hypothetical protein